MNNSEAAIVPRTISTFCVSDSKEGLALAQRLVINAAKEATLFNMMHYGLLLRCLTLLHFAGNCNGTLAAKPTAAKAHNTENPFRKASWSHASISPWQGS
jgi:hypothetical protein